MVVEICSVVHHSAILEFDVPSYRTNAAQQRGQEKKVNRQIQLTPNRQECLTRDTRFCRYQNTSGERGEIARNPLNKSDGMWRS